MREANVFGRAHLIFTYSLEAAQFNNISLREVDFQTANRITGMKI
jgi:hypothetical protein